jgi:hypothetical protein
LDMKKLDKLAIATPCFLDLFTIQVIQFIFIKVHLINI